MKFGSSFLNNTVSGFGKRKNTMDPQSLNNLKQNLNKSSMPEYLKIEDEDDNENEFFDQAHQTYNNSIETHYNQ
jgi:hypothetical protein